MKLGRQVDEAARAGAHDPGVEELREQARMAQVARRKTFVARLPLPDDATGSGDVPFWSAAIQQIEMHQWRLREWSVCPEASGPVAYAVFGTG